MKHEERTFQRLLDSGGFNRVVRGRHGDFAYNKNDIYVGRSIEKYGEFSEQEVDLFQQVCREGDFVIEVGANIGTHTIPIARRIGSSGHLLAFEPQSAVFQLLCANVALNSLLNVRCLQLAVGNESGQIEVPLVPMDQEGNFGGISLEGSQQGMVTPLVRLDDVFTAKRLRLLKVDVEGMEQQVLQGAQRLIHELRPAMYIENDRVDRSRDLIEFISSMGYELFWHLPPLFNPRNFASDTENIFPNIISVNMLCVPQAEANGINGLKRVDDPAWHPMLDSNS